jgi:hypothetical protein
MRVIPPESKIFGLTYGEWAARWWQWILSVPKGCNPATDTDGSNAAQNQSGPVWFLAGTFGTIVSAERKCAITSAKAIFVPIITTEKSWLEFPELKSEVELISRAENSIDRAKGVWAAIDSFHIQNLQKYRIKSRLFHVYFVEGNVMGLQTGSSQAVAEGYYLMIEQLGVGTHEINFGGAAVCLKDKLKFQTRVRYQITVTK